MKLNPRTVEEIAQKALIRKGVYACRITSAHDDHAKSGAEMMVLSVNVLSPSGQLVGQVTDRITENLAGGAKLRNFCLAFGMLDAYEKGELNTEDFINRTARCEVAIKRSKQYGDQNEILTYLAGPVAV